MDGFSATFSQKQVAVAFIHLSFIFDTRVGG